MVRTNLDPSYTREQICAIADQDERDRTFEKLRHWEHFNLLRLGQEKLKPLWVAEKVRTSDLAEVAKVCYVHPALLKRNTGLIARFIDNLIVFPWRHDVLDPFCPDDNSDIEDYLYPRSDFSGNQSQAALDTLLYNPKQIEFDAMIKRYFDTLAVAFDEYWLEHVVANHPTQRLDLLCQPKPEPNPTLNDYGYYDDSYDDSDLFRDFGIKYDDDFKRNDSDIDFF